MSRPTATDFLHLLPPSQPCAFLATNYMVLTRLAHALNAESALFIKASRVVKIFVWADVATFFLQAAGGGLSASASSADLGHKVRTARNNLVNKRLMKRNVPNRLRSLVSRSSSSRTASSAAFSSPSVSEREFGALQHCGFRLGLTHLASICRPHLFPRVDEYRGQRSRGSYNPFSTAPLGRWKLLWNLLLLSSCGIIVSSCLDSRRCQAPPDPFLVVLLNRSDPLSVSPSTRRGTTDTSRRTRDTFTCSTRSRSGSPCRSTASSGPRDSSRVRRNSTRSDPSRNATRQRRLRGTSSFTRAITPERDRWRQELEEESAVDTGWDS